MEKAIHFTNLKNFRYYEKDKFQRIYWGVEFCQNLIPDIDDTRKAASFAYANGLNFTLMTPFVTERGQKKLYKLFSLLKKEKSGCEIVVNDWGVLEVLNTEFRNDFALCLGRLLVRQYRNPYVAKTIKKQLPFFCVLKDGRKALIFHRAPSQAYKNWIGQCYASSALSQRFLSKLNIRRIELNNLIQGIDCKGIKLFKSVYTPYVNVSTTRFCPMETGYQKLYRINVCRRECQNYYDFLSSKLIKITVKPDSSCPDRQISERCLKKIERLELLKRGNTLFYKNPLNESKINQKSIDRIVYQPELPF